MHDDTNTVVITSTAKQIETNTVQEIISLLMKNPSAALVKRAKKIQKNLKTNLQEIKSLEKKLSKKTTSSSKVDTSRYKTTLCRYFSELGTCRNGEKCQFAHGDTELPSPTEIQNMEKNIVLIQLRQTGIGSKQEMEKNKIFNNYLGIGRLGRLACVSMSHK